MNSRDKAVHDVMTLLEGDPSGWEDYWEGASLFRHKNTGITIWMDNIPVMCTYIYEPCEVWPTLWQRYKLYRKINDVRSKMVSTRIACDHDWFFKGAEKFCVKCHKRDDKPIYEGKNANKE